MKDCNKLFKFDVVVELIAYILINFYLIFNITFIEFFSNSRNVDDIAADFCPNLAY